MSIRVIQCAAYGGSYRGSFIPMLEAAATETARRGHATTIVFPDFVRDRPWLGELAGTTDVRVVPTSGSRARDTGTMMRMLQAELDRHPGPSIIHTHFSTFDIPAVLLRLRNRRLAVFWHEHGPLFDHPYHRFRNTLRYASLGRLVSGMLCVSPELRSELRARHAPADRLYDFHNAIDTHRFAPATADERAAARRELGVPEGARVALHFAWDWELKGGDLMLAAADLLSSDPDLLLLTVAHAGIAAAARVDGRSNVRVLAPTEDVTRMYAASDVFLSCSRFEGALPLAALEALACGLALVVTDLPVQARLVAGLPSAVTVRAEPEAVAAGLRTMLDRDEADRVADAAVVRDRLASSFALDDWARRLVDLYETVAAPR